MNNVITTNHQLVYRHMSLACSGLHMQAACEGRPWGLVSAHGTALPVTHRRCVPL